MGLLLLRWEAAHLRVAQQGHAGSGVQDCHPEEGDGGPRQITVRIPGYTVCKTVSWPRNLTITFQKSKLYNCYSIADQAGGGSPVGDPREAVLTAQGFARTDTEAWPRLP